MADMSFSDLTNLLYENYGQLIVDNVIRSGLGNQFVPEQTLLGLLRSKGKVFIGGADGNNRYAREWALKTGGKTATSFGADSAYPVATQPIWADASIGWKRSGVMISIDNLVRLATRSGSMRGGYNGLGQQVVDALAALMADIDTQLAADGTGNGGLDIDGFAAFLSTGNTYATISQSGQALWQANISAASSAALTKTMMRSLVRTAWNRGAIGPNIEFCMDLLQFQKYATLYEESIRYMPGQMAGAVVPHYSDGAILIPIRIVKGVPTSEVWLLDFNHLEFRFLDHTPDDMLAQVKDEEASHEGVPIGFEQVQTGKDSKSIMVKAYGNLVCTNPYNQSAITGLATTAP
jgi:hypothetical protein